MKNLFTFAVLVALIFTLAACSGNSSIPGSGSGYSSSQRVLSSIDNSEGTAENPDIAFSDDIDTVTDAVTGDAQISVYNVGGHLINTVSKESALASLNHMLTDATVYSGEDLHLNNAPYRLEIKSDFPACYELWLRNDQIYFKTAGESTVYAPVNMDISELKQIINDKE